MTQRPEGGCVSHRQDAMQTLYRAGWTLERIGEAFSLTRERVRQLIVGLVPQGEGGIHVLAIEAAIARDTRKKTAKDKRTIKFYGCDHQTAITLNDGHPLSRSSHKAHRYIRQRENAKHRHIRWNISFPEWCRVWRDSGHETERGRGKGRYVMARNGDSGPYEYGNVHVCLFERNSADSYISKPASIRLANTVRSPKVDGLEPRLARAYDLYKSGVSVKEIAKQLGVTQRSAAHYLNAAKRQKGDFAAMYGEAA